MLSDYHMLGLWQFGSAGMLAWGFAAALPILIHLWSRRKYRQENWAAMPFLLAALRQNARRLQLEQWLLLAMRIAILLLFALALADPQWLSSSGAAAGANSGPTHVVIVIDGSYSMDYRSGERSRFQVAKELARQQVAAGQQGDRYTILLMADPPQVVIDAPAFDRGEVIKEIDALQLTHGGASLSATLAEVEGVLRRTVNSQRLTARRVCIFTDLQQTSWGEVNSADCRARLARLESLAALELIDAGELHDANFQVARLTVDSAAGGLAAVQREVQIQADIQSFARSDYLRQPLEILVDGQRIADERINCPADGRTTFAVKHRFDVAGDHIVEARLAGDALPLDNRRWLSIPVRDAIRILCVGGKPTDTKYLAMALAPQRQAQQSVQVFEATESRLLEGDLTQFDCLMLSNIGRFSSAEAFVIYRFVVSGGGLVVFLGDQSQADSYNRLFVDNEQLRLLPARLGQSVSAGVFALDPLEYRHGIVAPFRGFPQAGLLSTPIWKYLRLEPVEGAKTALGVANGDPAIVEMAVGRGRCILVATAASPDSVDRNSEPPAPWTALPTWPSFPPLVHEILRFSLSRHGESQNLVVGESIAGVVPVGTQDAIVTVSGPPGSGERLPIYIDLSTGRWIYGSANVSGVYEAVRSSATQRFAVNVDPREGDLTRLELDALPSQFRREGADAASETVTRSAQRAQPYYRWLLAAALVLLVCEPCLSWHFGKGRG